MKITVKSYCNSFSQMWKSYGIQLIRAYINQNNDIYVWTLFLISFISQLPLNPLTNIHMSHAYTNMPWSYALYIQHIYIQYIQYTHTHTHIEIDTQRQTERQRKISELNLSKWGHKKWGIYNKVYPQNIFRKYKGGKQQSQSGDIDD